MKAGERERVFCMQCRTECVLTLEPHAVTPAAMPGKTVKNCPFCGSTNVRAKYLQEPNGK
jgi:hypothetical protein